MSENVIVAPQTETQASPFPDRGVTFRAVALGLSIVILTNLWVTYAEAVVKSTRLNLAYFQLPLLALFVLLVGFLNPLLKLYRQRLAFSPRSF